MGQAKTVKAMGKEVTGAFSFIKHITQDVHDFVFQAYVKIYLITLEYRQLNSHAVWKW